MADAAASSVLRNVGEAAISALCIAVAIVPIGEMVFAIVSEAFIVVVTKFRKAEFHW